MKQRSIVFICIALLSILFYQCSQSQPIVKEKQWDVFLDSLQQRTLQYFLDVTDSTTGLSPDRWPASYSPSSVAAIGFAFTTFPISVEHGLISRQQAAARILRSMKYLYGLEQSEKPDASGYKGFYYHFLTMKEGKREWNCELSTVDTALLMAGVLCCQAYFDGSGEDEQSIRKLADELYSRVDWKWAMNGGKGITLGWEPGHGFHDMIWQGYNEAMIVYILALGSPTFPVEESAWNTWTEKYLWENYNGQDFISFAPLFGHQFSHSWIDFKGIQDSYTRSKGIDYFENSRRATYSQREYGKVNPGAWREYSDSIWGWTACDGPKDTAFLINGKTRKFQSYAARGCSIDWTNDDGTIAPTAVAGSVAFAPEICIPVLKTLQAKYNNRLFQGYGFIDAFNPSYITPTTPNGWFDVDYIGIDQGPIAIMIENYRNGFVWELMKKNPNVIRGLQRAGFTGGWLAKVNTK